MNPSYPADVCMACAECHRDLPANDFTRNDCGEPVHWECADSTARARAATFYGADQ